ncbi:hypothetical protein BaRGS_00001663 [Batillaria attramentaria]|uniref:SMB domain-containing protein n=1 Tax=Batillaria attramentaria TaxID=370345 RepID=A0ABD0M5N3_9CAEN
MWISWALFFVSSWVYLATSVPVTTSVPFTTARGGFKKTSRSSSPNGTPAPPEKGSTDPVRLTEKRIPTQTPQPITSSTNSDPAMSVSSAKTNSGESTVNGNATNVTEHMFKTMQVSTNATHSDTTISMSDAKTDFEENVAKGFIFPGDANVTHHAVLYPILFPDPASPCLLPAVSSQNELENAQSGHWTQDNSAHPDGDVRLTFPFLDDGFCDGQQWSCKGLCGTTLSPFHCSCHDSCAVYRTCCPDFHRTCNSSEGTNGKNSSLTQSSQQSTGAVPSATHDSSIPPDMLKDNSEDNIARDIFMNRWTGLTARCVTAVRAVLVDVCPGDADDSETDACAATAPKTFTDIAPVTDPVTGLHFRNVHCYRCWRRLVDQFDDLTGPLEDGPNVMNSTTKGNLPSPLPWKADISMSYKNRPPGEDSLTELVDHAVNNPETVSWSPPGNYSHHACMTHRFQACAEGVADDFDRANSGFGRGLNHSMLSELCQSFYSPVQDVSSLQENMYANKFCLLCSVLEEEANGKGDVSLEERLNALTCRVPTRWVDPYQHHVFTFHILLDWDVADSGWKLQNSIKPGETDRPGNFVWSTLRCDDRKCQQMNCTHFSMMLNGACSSMHHVVVRTTVVIMCLTTSDNQTCAERLESSKEGHSARSLVREIQEVLLSILTHYVPWLFEIRGPTNGSSILYTPDKGLYFAYQSATSTEGPFSARNIDDVTIALGSYLEKAGITGNVRLCYTLFTIRVTHENKILSAYCSQLRTRRFALTGNPELLAATGVGACLQNELNLKLLLAALQAMLSIIM